MESKGKPLSCSYYDFWPPRSVADIAEDYTGKCNISEQSIKLKHHTVEGLPCHPPDILYVQKPVCKYETTLTLTSSTSKTNIVETEAAERLFMKV